MANNTSAMKASWFTATPGGLITFHAVQIRKPKSKKKRIRKKWEANPNNWRSLSFSTEATAGTVFIQVEKCATGADNEFVKFENNGVNWSWVAM